MTQHFGDVGANGDGLFRFIQAIFCAAVVQASRRANKAQLALHVEKGSSGRALDTPDVVIIGLVAWAVFNVWIFVFVCVVFVRPLLLGPAIVDQIGTINIGLVCIFWNFFHTRMQVNVKCQRSFATNTGVGVKVVNLPIQASYTLDLVVEWLFCRAHLCSRCIFVSIVALTERIHITNDPVIRSSQIRVLGGGRQAHFVDCIESGT